MADGIKAYSEITGELIQDYVLPDHFYDVFGYSDSGFFVADKNKGVYRYDYEHSGPVEYFSDLGLYPRYGYAPWVDDAHTVQIYSEDGVVRRRAKGDLSLFDWKKRQVVWRHRVRSSVWGETRVGN